MKRSLRFVALWLATSLAHETLAQNHPHVGYIYPAGGQRGTVVEVTVGGQYLSGVNAAYIGGQGVRAEVIEHIRPMPRKVFNELNQKLRELNRRRQAQKITWNEVATQFRAFAESKNLKDFDLPAFQLLRKQMNDPKRQPNAQLAETVTVRLSVTDDAKPGNRELRLGTPLGLTNPLVWQVGQYPEYNETEPNDQTPDQPQPATLPLLINGRVLPGDVDRFRFQARQGTRLVAAVAARSLIPYLADAVPGWFQATLSLKDAAGREVAYSDDHGFHPDPVIMCRIPQDGEYLLEIHDAIYRGREDFVYRITLGEVPFVTSVYPLGGRAGQDTTVTMTGWNLRTRVTTVKAEDKQPSVIPVSVRRNRRESNCLPFALDLLEEIEEAEPNSQPSQAQSIKLPLIINGRIRRAGDWDVYRFTGRQGQWIVAEVHARRLGSRLDSLLKLTDDRGRLLASNDDFPDPGAGLTTHQADSRLSRELPADATFLLHLGDTQNQGGPAYVYRLRVSRPRPDFALRVVPSTINARAGWAVPLTVHALRQDGFDGPIDLKLNDMPAGFALSGAWVPAGQDQVRLTLTPPPTPLAEPVPFRLEGHATIDGRQVRRAAVPAEDMMQAFLYRHLVPTQQALVGVHGRPRGGPAIQLLDQGPVRLPAGGTAQVRLAISQKQAVRQIQLELSDPPEGVAIQKVTPHPQGLTIVLAAQIEAIKSSRQGNLIVEAFQVRSWKARDGRQRSRRNFLGVLPAIPYEIKPVPVAVSDEAGESGLQ